MPYVRDENAMEDARRDAMEDAYRDALGPCGGDGYVFAPCSGRHRWGCGGDECDGGDEVDCPGCEDCQPDED